jgi:catalase
MSNYQPPSERGIPLLTEVLAPAPESEAESEFQATPAEVSTQASAQWPAAVAPSPVVDEEERWRQLAQDVQEQVLQQLLGQVNGLFKQQVAEQMAIAFEHVTQQLTAQIQVNLEQALQQSVLLAVEQEIEKTRMTQNKGF